MRLRRKRKYIAENCLKLSVKPSKSIVEVYLRRLVIKQTIRQSRCVNFQSLSVVKLMMGVPRTFFVCNIYIFFLPSVLAELLDFKVLKIDLL